MRGLFWTFFALESNASWQNLEFSWKFSEISVKLSYFVWKIKLWAIFRFISLKFQCVRFQCAQSFSFYQPPCGMVIQWVKAGFFLTSLGRSGEGQSSETLSFFLEFWVFFFSFEFSLEFFWLFPHFFLISFKIFAKVFLISTFWKNLAIKMA